MGIIIRNTSQGGRITFRGLGLGGRITSGWPVASTSALLLDTYPGAAAAYSLRKLSSTYNGSAIRVRRSSDNTEQDIGFVNNELDTTSLTTFVGANSGFVTTWYDQSGNTNNTIQATAGNQPQIFNAGNVILQGTKPTLLFDGVNDYLDASGVTTGYPKSIFLTSKFTSILTGEKVLFDSITTNATIFFKDANNYIAISFFTLLTTTYTATTNSTLYSILHKNTSPNVFVNSNIILNNANFGSNSFNGLRIGAARGSASLYYNGNMNEFIIYGFDQAANRTSIESNINSYYTIY